MTQNTDSLGRGRGQVQFNIDPVSRKYLIGIWPADTPARLIKRE